MRDLFVHKGLVSEKRARQADRELKQERRQAQGDRRGRRVDEAEERRREAEAAERWVGGYTVQGWPTCHVVALSA